jgi:hypothetical protein
MKQSTGSATQCSPIPPLGSILRASPADPLQKIKHAAGLWKIEMEGLAEMLQVNRSHMYRVIQGERQSPRLRKRIAGFFQARVNDIWPPQEQGQGAQAESDKAGGLMAAACTRPGPAQTQAAMEFLRNG